MLNCQRGCHGVCWHPAQGIWVMANITWAYGEYYNVSMDLPHTLELPGTHEAHQTIRW